MTVKRNGEKVVLKDGKVSCSCCGVGCCMYPAQALFDGLYTVDDLPDSIIATVFNTVVNVVFAKSGSQYEATDSEGDSWRYLLVEGIGWQFERYQDEAWLPIQVEGSGACLIFESEGLFVRDQFADTYTISGLVSGTVTRVDLCAWRGDGLTLRYDGRLDANSLPVGTFKWRINGNAKSGLQNTPVGSYAGGFAVS